MAPHSFFSTVFKTTCPYPEWDKSSPLFPFRIFKIHFDIILQPMSRFPKWSDSFTFSRKNVFSAR